MKWLTKSDLPPSLPKGWNGLNKLIAEEGFPAGRMSGRNRIWTEKEVDDWLLSRPSAKGFLRGRAKQLAAMPAAPAPQGQQVDLEDLLG
jgi:hypothetical protein